MTLRRRLVLLMAAVLVTGLAGAALGTFGAVRQYLVGRTDQQLDSSAAALTTQLDAGGRFPEGDERSAVLWRALADRGGASALAVLKDRDGTVAQTITTGELPPRLDLSPGEGVHFERVDGGTGPDWRLRASLLPDGRVLLVGARLTEFDGLLRQLALIEIVVVLVALGVAAAFAPRLIRRTLRPLDDIGEAALAIGGGELSRRVPDAGAQTETGRLGLALNTMAGQIETAFADRAESAERLRQFVADASHELRTPVSSIMGYAELFRRGAASRPDDLAMAMRRIEAEAARMGELVDELLLLARLDENRPLAEEPVDLAGVAADAVADARMLEPARTIELDSPPELYLLGDSARLQQVAANLLANVRQHTPVHSHAFVRVAVEGEHAVLEVRDDGPGLTEEQCARVFERFYRTGPHRARDSGGAGLGLSIVAGVARLHGGRAEVSSRPGEGAVFRVLLPLPS